MLVSELIARLGELYLIHGDKPVIIPGANITNAQEKDGAIVLSLGYIRLSATERYGIGIIDTRSAIIGPGLIDATF